MSPEKVDQITNVLNGDGLSFVRRFTMDGSNIIMESSAGEASMTMTAARSILGVIEAQWGAKSAEAIGLRFLIQDIRP